MLETCCLGKMTEETVVRRAIRQSMLAPVAIAAFLKFVRRGADGKVGGERKSLRCNS